jgi:hypothetical protein
MVDEIAGLNEIMCTQRLHKIAEQLRTILTRKSRFFSPEGSQLA